MKLTGLCLVVTDPVASYETVAEAAVKAGLGYLQLRMKRAPRAEILATAKRLRAITRGTDTCFIVNDDPALAAEAEADGVHLGQGDLPLPEARAAFPGLRLFGLSTHSFAQMRAAEAVSPDYIGVGPLYATPTKAIPDPTLGPDEAGRIIRAAPWPTIAIGGIDEARLPAVAAAGATAFAVVRAVCRCLHRPKRARNSANPPRRIRSNARAEQKTSAETKRAKTIVGVLGKVSIAHWATFV